MLDYVFFVIGRVGIQQEPGTKPDTCMQWDGSNWHHIDRIIGSMGAHTHHLFPPPPL
jgi:hypothetical protein